MMTALSKIVLLSFVLSFAAFAQEGNEATYAGLNLSKYNPTSKVMNGITFPRLGPLLYRGFDSRYIKNYKVMQGLLGHPLEGVRSKGMWDLEKRYEAEGKTTLEAVAAAGKDVDRRLNGDYLLRQIDNGNWGFNDWPTDLIYTSVYPMVAFQYPHHHGESSSSVLVINDRDKRGIDLNFFSYSKGNNYWSNYGGIDLAVDTGEVVLATYIPSADFEGLMVGIGSPYLNYVKISEAYYKVKEGKNNFVLRMNTKDKPECFEKDLESGLIYQCKNNFSGSDKFPAFPARKAQAKSCGVFVVCDKDSALECGITPEFKAKHLLNGKCSGETSFRINDLSWEGSKVKYFTAER